MFPPAGFVELQQCVHTSQVMEVHASLLTCHITDGLTEDAVSARLHQGAISLMSLPFFGVP